MSANIKNFLDGLLKKINKKQDQVLEILNIIKQKTNIELKNSEISINNKIIKIKTGNYLRTEILFKKEEIIVEINNKTGLDIKDIF